MSGLRILEFTIAARLVFSEVIVPLKIDDAQRWLSISGGPIFNERNEFAGYSGIGTDLTEARRSENQARQLALFDTLTGLANRANFHDTLDELLKRSVKRHSPRSEEHTSELQSLMRISYAVFCLKKKKRKK